MKKYLLFLLISSLALIFASLSNEIPLDKNTDTDALPVPADIFKSYSLPFDLPADAKTNELALFAWKEIIALNWKSTYNPVKGIMERDVPVSSGWDYSSEKIPGGTDGTAVIWETYAHRTELRPANSGTAKANFDKIANRNLTGKPNYQNSFGENPYKKNLAKTNKFKLKSGKVMNAKSLTPRHASLEMDLLNCLDEDNEIGSCILYADAAGAPTTDAIDTNNLVLYQAKINTVGYQYKYDYFNSYTDLQSSQNQSVNVDPKTGANVNDFNKLKNNTASCDSKGLGSKKRFCFPCSSNKEGATPAKRGVVEVKTAWRRYVPGKDDLDDYFHRKAIYFSDVSEDEATVNNDLFLLIGMHILHKTENYKTFVIATFEHMKVENHGYGYISKPGGDNDYSELYKINSALRQYDYRPLYEPTTTAVHKALSKVNKNHYLLNYRLVGVQGNYTKGYPDEADAPSFFLSNYVIESDYHLSNFYGSFAEPQKGRVDGFFNLVVNDPISKQQMPVTTGGCKGCHGVAQTRGFDMSFIMDLNRPADMPDEGLISHSTIKKTYMQATNLFLEKLPKAPNLFLSAKVNNQKLLGVSAITVGSSDQIVVYDYDNASDTQYYRGVDGTPKDNFALVKSGKGNTYQLYFPSNNYVTNDNGYLSYGPKASALNFDVTYGDKGTITLTANGQRIYIVPFKNKYNSTSFNQLRIGKTIPSGAYPVTFVALGFELENYNDLNGFGYFSPDYGREIYLSYFDGYSSAGYLAKDPNHDSISVFPYNHDFENVYHLAAKNGQPANNIKLISHTPGSGGGKISFSILPQNNDGTNPYYLSINNHDFIELTPEKYGLSIVFDYKMFTYADKKIHGLIQLFYNGKPVIKSGHHLKIGALGDTPASFMVNSYKGVPFK